MRPLDFLGRIKVKLGMIILLAVAVAFVVNEVGINAGYSRNVRVAVAVVFALAMMQLLARGMTKPLREMAAAAQTIAKGRYGLRVTATSRDEVGELARAFNAMATDLGEVDRQRRELVANVSHELRTPITALRAVLENVVDGVSTPDPVTLGTALAQTERLGRLVAQLLDLSRLDSGARPIELEDVELGPLCDQALREAVLARDGVTARCEVPEGLSTRADPDLLAQVLANLLDNAVRHSPEGGVVVLAAAPEGAGVRLRVTDRGPGIPMEDRTRAFERFSRLDAGRAADEGGAGLGLAIVKEIVELHGGSIRVQDGPGCRIAVDLPERIMMDVPSVPGLAEDSSAPKVSRGPEVAGGAETDKITEFAMGAETRRTDKADKALRGGEAGKTDEAAEDAELVRVVEGAEVVEPARRSEGTGAARLAGVAKDVEDAGAAELAGAVGDTKGTGAAELARGIEGAGDVKLAGAVKGTGTVGAVEGTGTVGVAGPVRGVEGTGTVELARAGEGAGVAESAGAVEGAGDVGVAGASQALAPAGRSPSLAHAGSPQAPAHAGSSSALAHAESSRVPADAGTVSVSAHTGSSTPAPVSTSVSALASESVSTPVSVHVPGAAPVSVPVPASAQSPSPAPASARSPFPGTASAGDHVTSDAARTSSTAEAAGTPSAAGPAGAFSAAGPGGTPGAPEPPVETFSLPEAAETGTRLSSSPASSTSSASSASLDSTSPSGSSASPGSLTSPVSSTGAAPRPISAHARVPVVPTRAAPERNWARAFAGLLGGGLVGVFCGVVVGLIIGSVTPVLGVLAGLIVTLTGGFVGTVLGATDSGLPAGVPNGVAAGREPARRVATTAAGLPRPAVPRQAGAGGETREASASASAGGGGGRPRGDETVRTRETADGAQGMTDGSRGEVAVGPRGATDGSRGEVAAGSRGDEAVRSREGAGGAPPGDYVAPPVFPRPDLPATPRWVLPVCAAVGLLAAVALPYGGAGLGFVLVAVAMGVAVLPAASGRITPWSAGLGVIAYGMIAMVVFRDADWLVGLLLLAGFLLAALALSGAGRSWLGIARGGASVVLGLLPVPWFLAAPVKGMSLRRRMMPALLGLGLALVLVALFGGLFASADAVFARAVERVFLAQDWAESMPLRIVLFAGFALVVASAVLVGLRPVAEPRVPALRFTVGRGLWVTPLVALNLLFGVFVGMQLTVLFGSTRWLVSAAGLTYAEYARSGFFQLVVVSVFVLAIVAVASVVVDLGGRERWLMAGLLGVLCALTMVILVSALHRLDLYVEAYGFSRLRASVEAAIWWLGAVFVLVLIAGAVRLVRGGGAGWLPRALVAMTGVALLAFAVWNPDLRVAETQVAVRGVERLDRAYLGGLGAEAVPALDRLPEPMRSCVLRDVVDVNRLYAADPWNGWNLAREEARRLLSRHPVLTETDCPTYSSRSGVPDEY
ncbi:DUF4153 domain-containing protein [Streptosporangium sp. NPDC051022]|uniref:DUF4153 domain-containing protein n=1 Tax=Streptosporangium sp. NPDC051022 TaxID=3155752 RepID=UPI0034381733